MQKFRWAPVPLLMVCFVSVTPLRGQGGPFLHVITLGGVRRVPYTPPEATPETKAEDAGTLKVRPLLVDGRAREWTVGDMHEVTDRTFVIRRALRINDGLPGEAARWSWQPGPWLQVDRMTTHIGVVHLPDFDPQISEVTWFRDYAAYCGLVTTAKGGVAAVVAELGRSKAVAQHVLTGWPMAEAPHPVCAAVKWERLPMRATVGLTGKDPVVIDVAGTGAMIEEDEP